MGNSHWDAEGGSSRTELEPVEYYPAEVETHLRDYWYVILKRRWLILAVLTTVVSIAGVRALMRKPTYSATAVLQIDRGRINLVQDVMIQDYLSGYVEFYPTQQRVLHSRDLAARVVKQLRLWEHPYFTGAHPQSPDDHTIENLSGAVLGMLHVSQIRNTQLMEIRFTALEPKIAADLANALAHQYMAFHSEKDSQVAREATGFIREQVEKIQAEIQEKEKKLQDYSQREDLVMVDEKELIVMRSLEELNSEVTQARAARAAAEARYRSFASAAAASLPQVQDSATVQHLEQEQSRLERQVSELASKFKDDWPELKRAREALAENTAKLERERAAVARKIVAETEVEYRAALQREQLLVEEETRQKREAQSLNKLTTDYNEIKAEVDNQRAMLQQLLRRQSEAGLSADLGEQQQPVNVRVVEAALVPRGPNSSGVNRSVFMGTLIGLALSLGLAFFLDYWETTIYTIEDLRRYVPLPYLGMVPRLDASETIWSGFNLKELAGEAGVRTRSSTRDLTKTRSALALSQSTKLPSRSKEDTNVIAERFKFLRGSLLLSTAGAPPRTVLVTGPDKHAGKTFVACNLAASLADLDKKVLLMDADLRNPQLHKVFRFKNTVGLSNVLSGQTTIDQGCVVTTPIPNLYVLMAGPPSPNPAELLGSSKMVETLEQCQEHFDYVLMDSAPLLPVFDSHYLTVRCDANLLVVRSGQTSRNAVKQSLDLIDRVSGRVTGVVLNDVNLSDYAQNYYYTYHSYEYGTYATEEQVEERTVG